MYLMSPYMVRIYPQSQNARFLNSSPFIKLVSRINTFVYIIIIFEIYSLRYAFFTNEQLNKMKNNVLATKDVKIGTTTNTNSDTVTLGISTTDNKEVSTITTSFSTREPVIEVSIVIYNVITLNYLYIYIYTHFY